MIPAAAAPDETLAEDAPDGAPEAPLIDGRYRVVGRLGQGGMGEVLAAEDTEDGDRPCAVKVLAKAFERRPRAIARFEREAKMLSEISSEHVVKLLGFGRTEPDAPYLVLERLRGEDLRRMLDRRGPLPPAEAVRYVHQAALGLVEAHRAGLVHRDIKPSNLFLAQVGDPPRAVIKLVDFGIARRSRVEDTSLTATGEALGSPRYMSPEQVRNVKDVDARTDVWSLGVTLYELVTGTLPFEGSTSSAVSAAIVADAPIPPRARDAAIPSAVERVILACLEKDPGARYRSAAELAGDLSGLALSLDGGDAARRSPRTAILGAIALATVAGAVGLTTVLGADRRPREEIAAQRAPALEPPAPTATATASQIAAAPAPTVAERAPSAEPSSARTPAPAARPTPTQGPTTRASAAPTSAPRSSATGLVAGPYDDRK